MTAKSIRILLLFCTVCYVTNYFRGTNIKDCALICYEKHKIGAYIFREMKLITINLIPSKRRIHTFTLQYNFLFGRIKAKRVALHSSFHL